MLSHLRSCLTPGSRWRSLTLTLLLCAVAAMSLAAGDRAQPAHAAATLKPGDFIMGAASVWWLDRPSSTIQLLLSDQRLDEPRIVATGPNGEIYVVGNRFPVDDITERPAILRINPSTGALNVVASGALESISGLTVDSSGTMVVVDSGAAQIVRIDPITGSQSIVARGAKLGTASDVAVEIDGSILTTLAVTPNSDGLREVLRIRSGTNSHEIVSTGGLLVRPMYVAVAPDKSIFVSDFGGNLSGRRVIRIEPQSGSQTMLSDFGRGSGYVAGLVTDSVGDLFVVARDSMDQGPIFRIDTSNGQRSVVNRPYSLYPTGIAIVKAASEVACSPRPPVSVKTSNLGGGRLQVTVKASGSGNTIRTITPTTVPNATLETPPTIVGPDATFVVKRTGPGAVTVRFTVTDGCGDWPSFVGGGPNAF